MGFRSRRRHKGGGGGGGGGGGHGGGGNQAFAWTGEANGLQPGDDVGNRKSFKPVIVPPEDIGNRRDPDEEEDIPFDDVGNRVDANPTHEVSGILLDLDPKKRKRRAKGNQAPIERVGRYVVGGVNPLIAGGNRPPPPMPEDFDRSWQQQPPQQQQQQGQQQQPRQQQQHDQQPQQPRAEKKRRFEQVDGNAAQEVSEKRAQRFFDFDEDDRFDYTLKSTTDQKRKEALRFVDDILRECGRNARVQARIIEDGDKPKLLVTIDEKGPHARVDRLGEGAHEPLFVMGNGALLSLNYLANKVVNRYPDDRIRLAVLPASDEPLYLESLDEHQKRKRAEADGAAVAPVAPVVMPALEAAPVALEIAVAPAAPAEAPKPSRRSSSAAAKAAAAAQAAQAEATVEAPVAPAPIAEAPAPVIEAPVGKPSRPVAPAPVAAPIEADEAPAKKAPRRKTKKAEEIIPPMVATPPEPVAPEPEAPAAAAEPVAEAEEAPKGRRRAPPLDDLPRPARAPLEDPLGRGPPRGRPRRTPAAVEVVRVTKKT